MKNIFIISCLILFMFFMSIDAFAQENPPETEQKEVQKPANEVMRHKLGMSYSTLSGAGFHYARSLSEKFWIKAAGIYLYQQDEEDDEYSYSTHTYTEGREYNNADANFGLEYRYEFFDMNFQFDSTLIFSFITGGSVWYSKDTYTDNDETKKYKKWYTLGFGAGCEYVIFKHIYAGAHVSYQYKKNYGLSSEQSVGFGGGAEIGLKF